MEMSHEYASKGVAGAGLGTGIAGLSLGVLNSLGGLGALSGLLGNRNATQNDLLAAMLTAGMLQGGRACASPCGSDCDPVTQREMRLVQEIAAKDSQIALRDANTYGARRCWKCTSTLTGVSAMSKANCLSRLFRTRRLRTASRLLRSGWTAAAIVLRLRSRRKPRSAAAVTLLSSIMSTRRSIPRKLLP